jgi:hypothetical protein
MEQLLQKHFTQTVERIKTLDPKIVFDDALYQSRVITPTYIALCASISGINVIFPSSKEYYTQAMLTLRNDYLFEDDEKIKVKEGSKEKIQGIIKANFDLNRVKNGVRRWMLNKILNFVFYLLSALMAIVYIFNDGQNGGILLGLIFMLVSGGILIYESRSKLVYPLSKKVNRFKREHITALFIHIASFPFITLGINSVGGAMFFLPMWFFIFLKYDGEFILGSVYSEGKKFVVTRLLIGLTGGLIGLYFSFGASLLNVTTVTYVFASLFIGFSITIETRKAKKLSGTEWATEADHHADEMRKQAEVRNHHLPTITGWTQAGNKNYTALMTNSFASIMNLIPAIPIGAMMIPYFLYHLVLKIKGDKEIASDTIVP